jgi:hypothetical protein
MISSKEASASSILTSRRELLPCYVHACSATSRTTLATKSALSNSDIGMGGALSGYGGDSCSIEFLLLRFYLAKCESELKGFLVPCDSES